VFRAVINGVVRIGSFCLVFFLFITVFAILGMQLFGGTGDMNKHRSHFDNFGTAVMTLFIMCTGENTFAVGWDLMQATGESSSVIYVIVWSLVSTSLLALVLGVLIEAASKPIQEEMEGGGSGGAGLSSEMRTSSGKLVEIRGEETALTMLTTSKTRNALEAIAALRKKGVDEATIEKSEEMAKLNQLREETKAEVAAVRVWLFQTGMDLQKRKSTIPMPSSPTSILRRQREIELEVQAKVHELSDGFSASELFEAQERLVPTTGRKEIADVPDNVVPSSSPSEIRNPTSAAWRRCWRGSGRGGSRFSRRKPPRGRRIPCYERNDYSASDASSVASRWTNPTLGTRRGRSACGSWTSVGSRLRFWCSS
jgi:hypothetical protein